MTEQESQEHRKQNAQGVLNRIEEQKHQQEKCSHRNLVDNWLKLIPVDATNHGTPYHQPLNAYLLCQACEKKIYSDDTGYKALKAELDERQIPDFLQRDDTPVSKEHEALEVMAQSIIVLERELKDAKEHIEWLSALVVRFEHELLQERFKS